MPARIETSPERDDTLTINMGPSHPATHGVLRCVLTLERGGRLKAMAFRSTGTELGRTLVHREAVDVISAWIRAMPATPCR